MSFFVRICSSLLNLVTKEWWLCWPRLNSSPLLLFWSQLLWFAKNALPCFFHVRCGFLISGPLLLHSCVQNLKVYIMLNFYNDFCLAHQIAGCQLYLLASEMVWPCNYSYTGGLPPLSILFGTISIFSVFCSILSISWQQEECFPSLFWQ